MRFAVTVMTLLVLLPGLLFGAGASEDGGDAGSQEAATIGISM